MCGRLACGLEPEEICNCCSYKMRTHYFKLKWASFYNQGKTYQPSYNICPTEVAPVLLPENYSLPRSVAPMIFGLMPSWDKKGNTKKLATFNCRIETIATSKMYGKLFQNGQRCVVVCNGFYEWQKKEKPYFIHAKQSSGIVMNDPTTWNLETANGNGGSCLKLLRLAALYDVQTSKEGSTYSFAIITREASTDMTWLHNRMPLIVETEDQLNVWLKNRTFDSTEALNALIQNDNISWFQVSSSVSDVKNKTIGCIKPIKSSDEKKSNMLTKWLGKKPKEEEQVEEVPEKKPKEEDQVDVVPGKKPKEEDQVDVVPRKKPKEEDQVDVVPGKKPEEEDEVPLKKRRENEEC